MHTHGEMLEEPAGFSFEICVDNTSHATNRITDGSQNVRFIGDMTAIGSMACWIQH